MTNYTFRTLRGRLALLNASLKCLFTGQLSVGAKAELETSETDIDRSDSVIWCRGISGAAKTEMDNGRLRYMTKDEEDEFDRTMNGIEDTFENFHNVMRTPLQPPSSWNR
jgi:hypothetical protein